MSCYASALELIMKQLKVLCTCKELLGSEADQLISL